jgi:hypothetical protein
MLQLFGFENSIHSQTKKKLSTFSLRVSDIPCKTNFSIFFVQQFLHENKSSSSGSGNKSTSQTDLKETVMALRLRETYLVCDLNLLKQKLMELETQVGCH